jgi:transposase
MGGTAKNNRLFVEAVLYRYRAGIPWRDLPARFGDFRVVHTRFSRWSKSGVWQRIFQALADEADNEYALIDSTIVRAHQHSAGTKKGAPSDRAQPWRMKHKNSRHGGGARSPDRISLDAGASTRVGRRRCPVAWHRGTHRHHRYRIRCHSAPLKLAGKRVVIRSNPTRKHWRKVNRSLYRVRHLIENFFNRLKQYRAIATGYDKTARNFLGAIYFVAAVVWLN